MPRPLLNGRLWRKPTFASASVAMFCVGAALFGAMILVPLDWQSVRPEDVVITGLLTAPQGLGAALAMLCVAMIVRGMGIGFAFMPAMAAGLTALAIAPCVVLMRTERAARRARARDGAPQDAMAEALAA